MTDNDSIASSNAISKTVLGCVLAVCVILPVVLGIMFWQNRFWDNSYPVDNGLFGNYGDFVGGVVGTIVAFYSAYLLVKTFQSQEKVNQSVIETNRAAAIASEKQLYNTMLEVFNNKFGCFISSYQQAIDHYVFTTDGGLITGRKAFEAMCKAFLENGEINANDYSSRCASFVSEYIDFYSSNRIYMSVHFRLLYLLVSLVSNSDLDDDDKVLYAKLIRGQLSDMEMIALRYNCHSEYGQKMQRYCNEFNLTKHLPVMQLLEFKSYNQVVKEAAKMKPDEKYKELIVGLDTLFITLRKYAKIALDQDDEREFLYDKCKSYSIIMRATERRTKFILTLNKDTEVQRRGGGERLSATEKALDCFTDEQLEWLFRDFLSELFYASNFFLYNGHHNAKKGKSSLDGNIHQCRFTIKSDQRLVLSARQVEERTQRKL